MSAERLASIQDVSWNRAAAEKGARDDNARYKVMLQQVTAPAVGASLVAGNVFFEVLFSIAGERLFFNYVCTL